MLKRLTAACAFAIALGGAGATPSGSAWFGSWSLRAQDADGKPETLVYSDAGNGAMRMESVEVQSVIVTHFDGVPVEALGPGGKTGSALAVKATSPTSYTWTFWIEGKPFVEGVNVLADDRQSFTEVSWRVGRPDQKVTLIYERR